ncbi:AAA family ATPase [Mycobacteriaceae bacterium NPDC060252]
MTALTHDSRFIGRDDLRNAVTRVATDAENPPNVLLLVGDAGIGKSTLLMDAVAAATQSGHQVLFAAGGEPELLHAYTSLTELVWPLHQHVNELPAPLRDTLNDILGVSTAPSPRGPIMIRHALLALLKSASRERPLLLALDDVDLLDRDTYEVVTSVSRRLIGTSVSVIMTARRRESLAGFDSVITVLDVPPLTDREASDLLDAQAPPPERGVRGELIRWSGGNPLALIEGARFYGVSGATVFHANSLPGYRGVHSIFSMELAALDPDARKLLLYSASGSGYETVDVVTQVAGYGSDVCHWRPAETMQLVSITPDRRIKFCHPLLRTLAYTDSSLTDQREAHQSFGQSPLLDAPCRAWHLAAAATGPDETIASALEQSARQAQRRGGYLEVARVLQRAAELSPHHNNGARRYARAAAAANFGGDPAWALTLCDKVSQVDADANVLGYASLTRGSIRLQAAQATEAFELVRRSIEGATPPEGRLALTLTYLGASASYYSGDIAHREALQKWLPGLPFDDAEQEDTEVEFLTFPVGSAALQRSYIGMYADTGAASHIRPTPFDRYWLTPQATSLEPFRHLVVGVMAAVTEESDLARCHLTEAVDSLKGTGGMRGFTYAMAPLAWALLDTGRWDHLDELLASTRDLCEIHDLTLLHNETTICRAQLVAYRGDAVDAAAVLRTVDTSALGTMSSPTRTALTRAHGWTAIAQGDFDSAYLHFREQFHADGTPAHFVVAHRGVADLAWAAARSGRTEEVRPLIDAIGQHIDSGSPTRIQLLHHLAMALTSSTADAENHFRLAVGNPAGEQWPLERARARLHYGEWLRRARRPAETRPHLSAALTVLERHGAETLAALAKAELRAAGVVSKSTHTPAGFDALTAQERQIVRLAASGMTNRQIGDQLNLSPRTIASHLYHVYPKLGVSRRHELRDVIE